MYLGVTADGRALHYEPRSYEFFLDGVPAAYGDVRAYDDKGLVTWRALEQRDWFRRVNEQDLNRHAAAVRDARAIGALDPHEQVLADAARDDGVLAGAIVDADPVLVQAVADELQKRGVAVPGAKSVAQPDAKSAAQPAANAHANAAAATQAPVGAGEPEAQQADVNPLAEMDLPHGMEALSQLERARPQRRDMTRAEKRLMKKILRNDDKAKAKRERLSTLDAPDEEVQHS